MYILGLVKEIGILDCKTTDTQIEWNYEIGLKEDGPRVYSEDINDLLESLFTCPKQGWT